MCGEDGTENPEREENGGEVEVKMRRIGKEGERKLYHVGVTETDG